jgi:hypothetical protein
MLKAGNNGNYAADLLTPDDRKRIMESFEGYDISPDMVRLSLANLYLHGFPSPRIHEYDTLTSEDRWGETFDVILANPPFMTPKGGIRPHKRFSIQANRSEVLFVDYIAEHLSTSGRAGVIVPEGIIFQSANAYKHFEKCSLNRTTSGRLFPSPPVFLIHILALKRAYFSWTERLRKKRTISYLLRLIMTASISELNVDRTVKMISPALLMSFVNTRKVYHFPILLLV